MKTHLVIPDEHYFAGDNFRRCEAVSNLISEVRPDVIIRLGDMWDMPSLCSYDRGKKSMVFKNVKDDIESGHRAERLLFNSIMKTKKYSPYVIKCLGNHENRVAKLLEYDPQWEGSVSMDDFKTRLPIEEIIVDYNTYVEADGVYYSHVFASGVMGRPVSSAKALITKKSVSCTMGHSHVLDYAVSTKPDGTKIRGLIAGCFQDPETQCFGGKQVQNMYWNGIFVKRCIIDGDYDLEEISMGQLLKDYL